MDRERLRTASFEEIWSEVIDPLYIEAASSPSSPPSRPEAALDVLALWLLHGVAARSGLRSLVAEEPPWMSARMSAAARRLGHEDIAALWDRMSDAIDLAAQAGMNPASVRFADDAAQDRLEELLVRGAHADLNRWLAEHVRAHPADFAAG